jgi:hypothetical protein
VLIHQFQLHLFDGSLDGAGVQSPHLVLIQVANLTKHLSRDLNHRIIKLGSHLVKNSTGHRLLLDLTPSQCAWKTFKPPQYTTIRVVYRDLQQYTNAHENRSENKSRVYTRVLTRVDLNPDFNPAIEVGWVNSG